MWLFIRGGGLDRWLLIEPGGRGVGGGGLLPSNLGLWGCAAGWGRIFMTGLTITGLYF